MRIERATTIAFLDQTDVGWNDATLHEARRFQKLVHSFGSVLAQMMWKAAYLFDVIIYVAQVFLAHSFPSAAVPKEMRSVAPGLIALRTGAPIGIDVLRVVEAVWRADAASKYALGM